MTDDTTNGNHAEDDEEEDTSFEVQFELDRLADLGVPFPGVEVHVDKHVVKVWLETLEVECTTSAVLRDRVKRIVDNAVEIVAPMWSAGEAKGIRADGHLLKPDDMEA